MTASRLAVLLVLLLFSIATLVAAFVDRGNRAAWAVASIAFHCALLLGGYLTAMRHRPRPPADTSRIESL